MRKPMDRAEVRAWAARWRRVNNQERAELQATPLEVKFRQLAALMASVEILGWKDALASDEAKVRARWAKLRKHYGV